MEVVARSCFNKEGEGVKAVMRRRPGASAGAGCVVFLDLFGQNSKGNKDKEKTLWSSHPTPRS